MKIAWKCRDSIPAASIDGGACVFGHANFLALKKGNNFPERY